MILLVLIRVTLSLPCIISENVTNKFAMKKLIGALPLGFLFALEFCPISAALFVKLILLL